MKRTKSTGMEIYFRSSFLIVLMLVLGRCTNNSNTIESASIIPEPQYTNLYSGQCVLASPIKIYNSEKEFNPIEDLLVEQLFSLSGGEVFQLVNSKKEESDLIFMQNNALEDEAYKITVKKNIQIEASNYKGMARALASLIQLMKYQGQQFTLPIIEIEDKADYEYRAVMLDLARFWHPVETIKETIDLLWYYKIPYLHLHLSDNRRFTFPMEEFPKLKTINKEGNREYYTIEELNDLVEYAKQRGIAIIPEIDLPGHSTQLWGKYPEIFGSINPANNEAQAIYVINLAKEECYQACEQIIKRLAEVFYTSPYIHFGGDEVWLEALKGLPEYESFCKEHNLTKALEGDANELFYYFINRMHNVVKANDKETLIWEGFHGTGAGSQEISKEIKVLVWNTTYNRPDSLINNGYKIVNATWNPWYYVGAMNLAPDQKSAYDWNITEWSHWDNNVEDIMIAENHATLGGQICFWEQNHYKVIPILRERVPAFAERLWNYNTGKDYSEFSERYEKQNKKYAFINQGIEIQAQQLLHNEDQIFIGSTDVIIQNNWKNGVIKYVISDDWEMPSFSNAKSYTGSFTINESAIISAQLFDAKGLAIGNPIQSYYRKIDPVFNCKVYGPAPIKGWDEMPDFDTLNLLRETITGRITNHRLDIINGELFAKVKREGHIETRFNEVYNQYAVELTGKINFPGHEACTIRLQTHDGLAEIFIDGKLVCKGQKFENEAEDFEIVIDEGIHDIRIKYYYRQIQNQLNIMYKTDRMKKFKAFEDLIIEI